MSCFQTQTDAMLDKKLAENKGVEGRIDLTDAEVERLAEILDRVFSPPVALREALSQLADPKRQPPQLHWNDTVDCDPGGSSQGAESSPASRP